MPAADGAHFEPLLLPLGPAGSALPRERFAVLHRPAGTPRGLVVHAPAWAEEMNKSRRMVAQQARALAQAGHAVLVPDLAGCGDSPGDFGDATWALWLDDLLGAAAWLRSACTPWGCATPPPLTLWGLRAGTLLAAQAAARLGDVHRLLLWQPATQGRALLQQFLRVQVAGELLGGDARAGTEAAEGAEAGGGTRALLAQLQAGQTLEIAGYRLSPALAQGLGAARLAPGTALGVHEVIALELQARDDPTPSPAVRSALAAWEAAGCRVQASAHRGPAFWQTTEIEDAPALVQATLQALQPTA
jgi:exosortase A-associated hydrolase 2